MIAAIKVTLPRIIYMYNTFCRSLGIAVVTVALFYSSNVNAQETQLIYNFDTGNVQIEIIEATFSLFSIVTGDEQQAEGSGFINPLLINSDSGLGDPSSADVDSIVYISSSGPFAAGIYDIGNIFPLAIDFEDRNNETLSQGFDVAGNTIGFGAFAFTVDGGGDDANQQRAFNTVTTLAIPEPTTLPLLAVASSLFLKRRRRR